MIEEHYENNSPILAKKLSLFLPKASLSPSLFKFLKIQFVILLSVLFTSTSLHASYAKLAKEAGISHRNMEDIVKKVVKYESTTGHYYTKNRNSGAYGRYQIMPRTAHSYAEKLNIPKSKWKLAKNQDRIFKAILHDNISALKRNGLKISAFSIYGTHQQGAYGFNAIMKNKTLTKGLERNLRHNLPKKYRHVSRAKLGRVWKNYWEKKFS